METITVEKLIEILNALSDSPHYDFPHDVAWDANGRVSDE